MELEERSIEDPFAARCEVCGAELTQLEIETAREGGGPFLCSVHTAEELPGIADDPPGTEL